MLRLLELPPSPNSTKIRMALRYKEVPFEAVEVDPADRGNVIESTGQELTPAIEDKGVALNDSEAILQYLDANYPEAPRLFPRRRMARRACDAWKKELDEKLAKHWLPVFLHAIGRSPTLDEDAQKRYRGALAWLERELEKGVPFAPEPDQAVNDLRVAEWATYALPGEGLIERVKIFRRFAELFGVDKGEFPQLEAFLAPWNERLA